MNSRLLLSAPARPATLALPPLTWATVVLAALALALGGLIAALPPLYAAALFLATVVVPAALARPLLGICLALATIPLATEWSMNVGGLNLTLMEPAVGLAFGAWLWRGLRERSLRIWPSALLAAQFAVLGLFVLSSLNAEAPGPSLKDTLKWIELMVAYVVTVDLARAPRDVRWVLLALVGAATLEAAYGLVQFATGRGPDFFAIGPFMRAFGHFNQPNPFAGYLGTAFPLAAALALGAPIVAAQAGRADLPVVQRWFTHLALWARPCALVLGAGVLASLSRGAWLGLAVAGAVMLAVASARSRALLLPLGAAILLVALLGAVGVLPAPLTERLSVVAEYFGPFDVRRTEVTPENWSVVERMAHWQAAWEMFLDHPWFGIGPGNYATQYEFYYLPGWLEPLGHAHNYYLNLAAETGVLGLAGFLGVLALAHRAALQGCRRAHPFWRTVALGTLGSLVAITLHSGFDNLFVHGVSVQIGVLFALASLAASPPEPARG